MLFLKVVYTVMYSSNAYLNYFDNDLGVLPVRHVSSTNRIPEYLSNINMPLSNYTPHIRG